MNTGKTEVLKCCTFNQKWGTLALSEFLTNFLVKFNDVNF